MWIWFERLAPKMAGLDSDIISHCMGRVIVEALPDRALRGMIPRTDSIQRKKHANSNDWKSDFIFLKMKRAKPSRPNTPSPNTRI